MPILPSLPAQLGAHEPFTIPVPVPVPATKPGMNLGEGKGLINPSDETISILEAFFMEKDEPADALTLYL